MTVRILVLCGVLSLVPACAARHGAPVLDTGAKPAEITGTIAGKVSADSAVALSGRKVTATAEDTGMAYGATTSTGGGYTIKVPAGHRYRLDVELRAGEKVARAPDPTQVNASDLDPDRNFVLTVAR
jgi:hypothetical protein